MAPSTRSLSKIARFFEGTIHGDVDVDAGALDALGRPRRRVVRDGYLEGADGGRSRLGDNLEAGAVGGEASHARRFRAMAHESAPLVRRKCPLRNDIHDAAMGSPPSVQASTRSRSGGRRHSRRLLGELSECVVRRIFEDLGERRVVEDHFDERVDCALEQQRRLTDVHELRTTGLSDFNPKMCETTCANSGAPDRRPP